MFLTGKRHWYTHVIAHKVYSQSTYEEKAKLAFKAGYACTQRCNMPSLLAVVNQS